MGEAMRPLTRRALLLVPCVLAMVGCQPEPLEVWVTNDAGGVVITSSGDLPWRQAGASIATVAIWPKDSGYEDRLWEIRSNRCPTNIHEVHYGVSPPDFHQEPAAQPLVEGADYVVWVDRCDGRQGGGTYFRMIEGRASMILRSVARVE
ncbi:hypothetical protein [Terricaulis silvestris]|uniref:Lipoprotein n=1 Tax=Terricaulis silvestris TaxID=2686094 RepID=A0A6I6MQR8_9CAUL|nr:hypothetical protein [Terricaulis silvestris]QGZ96501.1 hypothetical protein DSM104635_03361 [Terricaulis silvestris]